jgi:hypothetical protein
MTSGMSRLGLPRLNYFSRRRAHKAEGLNGVTRRSCSWVTLSKPDICCPKRNVTLSENKRRCLSIVMIVTNSGRVLFLVIQTP